MAGLTKANTYLAFLFVIGIFSLLVYNIGVDASNSSRITLDNQSSSYVSSYADFYEDESGFNTFRTTSSSESANEEILTGSNETGEVIATDNFAIPKATQGSIAGLPNLFKLIFNVPSLILLGLGMGVEGWATYINVFAYILSFSLIILFVKMTFSGGND